MPSCHPHPRDSGTGHPSTSSAASARPVEAAAAAAPAETARRAKIGVYLATWWALNVIFNIYNKKVLNAVPYPWLTSTLSLAAGSAIMLASWATKIADAPSTDLDFLKALSPVAIEHTIGHVAATCSDDGHEDVDGVKVWFMGAMISNLAFVLWNIFPKKRMKDKSVSGMNYYSCLSMLSLVILLPFAFAMEGPKVWAVGWQKAIAEIGPNFVWWVAA
ncbi:hypothetical protein E2562_024234 [Oryza meyeriana var. granulata]|uniref:Sugar phosphate transporter domain-containing protein n=1 Tax=Oryza meyeriana var. granulata TaxID=110450 RepID=A0A6G1E0Z2_9ORYZ|nr:hypothetical protein E2562_024234 [Oryza meyeriana var. granulata]